MFWVALLIAVAIVVVVIVIVAISPDRDDKAWLLIESSKCPGCGETLGPQDRSKSWGVDAEPVQPSVPDAGLVVICNNCHREFWYSMAGERVTYWGDPTGFKHRNS